MYKTPYLTYASLYREKDYFFLVFLASLFKISKRNKKSLFYL